MLLPKDSVQQPSFMSRATDVAIIRTVNIIVVELLRSAVQRLLWRRAFDNEMQSCRLMC